MTHRVVRWIRTRTIGLRTERGKHSRRSRGPDTGYRSDLLDAGLPDPGHRTEVGDQCFASGLAQSGHRIECRFRHALRALTPMVGNREAVRFIANPLQQVKPLTVTGQDHRVGLCRHPHLLQSLRESDHRDVGDTEFMQHSRRGVDLRGTAVHDVEIGWIGEFAGLVARGRPRRFGRLRIGDVTLETAPGDLRNGGHIIGAALPGSFSDREMAIIGLAGQTVLEHHQRPHHIGALHMTDVHTFDPQRRIRQTQ